MSFMFNPFDYDDQTAINRPELDEGTVQSVISGIEESAYYISKLLAEKSSEGGGCNVAIALEGYIGAMWDQTVNLVSQYLKEKLFSVTAVDFSTIFKTPDQLDRLLSVSLESDPEKDPVKLFGRLYDGTYEEMLDSRKLQTLSESLEKSGTSERGGEVIIVYGCGCTVRTLRPLYDFVFYFDVTPKEVVLRARKGFLKNLGDHTARPLKELLRRCYYVDYEVAVKHRRDLIENDAIDFYIASDDPVNINMMPWRTFRSIMSSLVRYPFRCKPVYLEGVWGGQYLKKIRNLPERMKNCAWAFDLIPLEVSIVAEAGRHMLEFPFFTFVQAEGEALMGKECMEKFKGYFPVRLNYDDTWHGNGNMSIQVHSGHEYNITNFNELGRQDESYYVVVAGHGAKTYIGFWDEADTGEFINEVKKSEKEFTPVDYGKYVNSFPSRPGMQFMIPSGTIHASGRNQLVLETGSLTVGSYTYKLYDYLRSDLDGVPRPIHTYHGEHAVIKERTTSWVKENLVRDPILIRKGDKYAEYVIGEHHLIYFSLRRLEFEEYVEDDTNGKFHALVLIDGEKVMIRSVEDPGRFYIQNYLDIVIVPATFGKYIIKNQGNEPVCIHKTVLKDGFMNDRP